MVLSKLQNSGITKTEHILLSQSPSLAFLRTLEFDLPYRILGLMLNSFLNFVNVGKNMNRDQILETTRLMMQDYAVLKPDDFILFFDRAKKGWYGKAYDRMDGSIILEWLELYMQQRNEEIEQIRINEAKKLDRLVSDAPGVPMPDYVKEFKDKMDANKEKTKPIPNISDQDVLIHGLLVEFGHLSNTQKTTGLVTIDGVRYDKESFLKMKLGYE
jgi:hypothetical protein